MRNTRIYLEISEHAMMFPYPPDNGANRNDGFQNYGGKLLKCRLDQIETIPEINNDLALKNIVKSINAEESLFISLGCSSFENNPDENIYFVRGYIQISFNDKILIQNPANYFNLFMGFNQFVTEKVKNLNVTFTWKLEEVRFDSFIDSTLIMKGFSVVIGIETDRFNNGEDSLETWSNSLMILSDYLSKTDLVSESKIYECND